MNLHLDHIPVFIPEYKGLTNDQTYLKVRRDHYPLTRLSANYQDLLTATEVKKFGLSLRSLIPFVAYEAYPFENHLTDEYVSKWIDLLLNDFSWDLCSLGRLSKSEMKAVLKKCQTNQVIQNSEQKIWCFPYPRTTKAQIDQFQSFDEFIQSRSQKFRKNYRYTHNQLIKHKIHYSQNLTVSEMIELYQIRHVKKDIGDYSVTTGFHQFLTDLWNCLLSEKRLYVLSLRANDPLSQTEDKPIAGLMGFYQNNILQVYQIAYNPDFGHLNPGRNLLIKCIQDHFDSEITLIDFMSEANYVGEITPYYLPYNRITLTANNLKMKSLNYLRKLSSKFRPGPVPN